MPLTDATSWAEENFKMDTFSRFPGSMFVHPGSCFNALVHQLHSADASFPIDSNVQFATALSFEVVWKTDSYPRRFLLIR